MNSPNLFIFGLAVVMTLSSFGQSSPSRESVRTDSNDSISLSKINEKAFALSENMTLAELQKAYKIGKNVYGGISVNRGLGHAFYCIAQYDLAAHYYSDYLKESDNTGLSIQEAFEYAHALKSIGKLEESDTYMSMHYILRGETPKASYIPKTEGFNNELILNELSVKSGDIVYPTWINPKSGDLLVTVADSKDKIGTGENLFSEIATFDSSVEIMFQDKTKGNAKISRADAVVTKDGNTMYYSRNEILGETEFIMGRSVKVIDYEIYFAQLEDGEWIEKGPVSFNFKNASNGHAVLSPDEDYMYFTSDNKDTGMGMADIYKVARYDVNSFGTPENLGPVVNSFANEGFPCIVDDVLYFSSQGHENFGGSDIFEAKIEADGFSEPVNLGPVVNSSNDDFAFTLDQDKGLAYFASNRSGQDIVLTFLLEDLYEEEPQLVVVTNPDVVEEPINDNATEPSISADDYRKMRLEFEKLDFVFYAFASYQISDPYKASLDTIAQTLMKYDGVKVRVESHTDPIGSEEFNQTLSEKRSESVKNYLISQGIAADRISVAGFGESKTIFSCDKQPCSIQEHLINRRSEFIYEFN